MQKGVIIAIIVLALSAFYFALNTDTLNFSPMLNAGGDLGGPDACTDSDGGLNYKVKGTTCDDDDCFTDTCFNPQGQDTSVVEYYCDGDEVENEKFKCENLGNNYRCLLGKCTNLYPGSSHYETGQGSNHLSDPPGMGQECIKVCTPQELDNVRYNLDECYIQTCDIDLSNYPMEPIGAGHEPFTGSYDGNGYKIKNLRLEGDSIIGLFGLVREGELKSISIENGLIIGNQEYARGIGGLAGGVGDNTKVINCNFQGKVTGGTIVGGLIGGAYSGSIVENSWFEGEIESITDTDYTYKIGGLIGEASRDYWPNKPVEIKSCSAKGKITLLDLPSQNTGGLIGLLQESKVSDSSADMEITFNGKDSNRIGGFIGSTSNSTILRSSSKGTINSNGAQPSYIGGFAGIMFYGEISDSDSDVRIQGNGLSVGGLIGNANAENGNLIISSSHSLGEIDIANPYAINIGGFIGGLSAGQQHTLEVKDSHSWSDVSGDRNIGGFAGRISVYENGKVKFQNSFSKNQVSGTFDTGGFVGHIRTWENGEIEFIKSYSEGNVEGTTDTGGFIGNKVGDGKLKISNSYSTNTVNGDYRVGGFIAELSGDHEITNCYSTGKVTGTSDIGGFIAQAPQIISITNSYWDTQTSGQSQSAGGEGRTTAEMTTVPRPPNTYVNWDFQHVWDQTHGNYPWLR